MPHLTRQIPASKQHYATSSKEDCKYLLEWNDKRLNSRKFQSKRIIRMQGLHGCIHPIHPRCVHALSSGYLLLWRPAHVQVPPPRLSTSETFSSCSTWNIK